MDVRTHYPNRTRRLNLAPGNTTWNLVGYTGTLYASYDALVAAGDLPWPGGPTSFPTGIPFMDIRTKTAAGADGDVCFVYTNNRHAPPNEDDMISGSGQHMVYENDGIDLVWIKLKTSTDTVILFGMF